jgi:hypothetical protein
VRDKWLIYLKQLQEDLLMFSFVKPVTRQTDAVLENLESAESAADKDLDLRKRKEKLVLHRAISFFYYFIDTYFYISLI